MKILFALAFEVYSFTLGTIAARAEEPCELTYDMMVKAVDKIAATEPDAVIIRLSGIDAGKIVAVYNAEPPESNIEGTHVFVIKRAESVAFAITSDACILVTRRVSVNGWNAFERKALGDPS